MADKMYGSYSDADLNDWERFPMNANVLTSSAFGAWLLRRDERRDKVFLRQEMSKCRYDLSVDCNNKNCVSCVLDKIRTEIEQLPTSTCTETCRIRVNVDDFKENVLNIIDKYKGKSEG